MKRLIISFTIFISIFLSSAPALAAEDPLSVPNNKIGIHLLFPSELEEAAKLINSNGGDWGYVIIPIQSGDKDLKKWQKFMDEAARLHIIPIIRLATEGDYFNTSVWRKPHERDVMDFANFLNSLHWPTKNRYIVVFNETNRSDEWGGSTNPSEYAQLLSYSVTVFKSKNPDFFIIGGGFDNGAPHQGTEYNDQYRYMQEMDQAVPGIFNQIDGFASHSYPNPGFSQPPTVNTPKSIASFSHERALLRQLSSKKLPIFITETGWTSEKVSDATRASYYTHALSAVWNDPDIVAITPFLLRAHGGPFIQFSFLKEDGSHTQQYKALKDYPKTKGTPLLSTRVLGVSNTPQENLKEKKFLATLKNKDNFSLSTIFQNTFAWIMKI